MSKNTQNSVGGHVTDRISAPATAFVYQGEKIHFLPKEENTMVNATQMAKVFGKNPKDWLGLKSTNNYLLAVLEDLEKQEGNSPLDLKTIQKGNPPFENYENIVIVVKGGRNSGTWMHYLVAMEFARWLNPKFAIWTNRILRNLLEGEINNHFHNGYFISEVVETQGVFTGITFVMHKSKKYYVCSEMYRFLGLSKWIIGRKSKQYPEAFFKLFGRKFIYTDFATFLFEHKTNIIEVKNNYKQLELEFVENLNKKEAQNG